MPNEPEQVDLEQLRRDIAGSKRVSQAQRRNLALFRRRPQPPRDVRVDGGQLAWEEPQETRNVTQYRIYAPDDQTLYTAVPVGSRQLNGLLPGSPQIYISSYNENSGLESRRVSGGPAVPATPDTPELPPGTYPLASNIQSATATTTYLNGQYGFTGTITLNPAAEGYVAPTKVQVSFKGPDGAASEVPVAAVAPEGPSVGYAGSRVGTQNAFSHTGTLIFTSINQDGRPTPDPYTLAVTIAAGKIDGVIGREVPDATRVDPDDRLVYTTIGIKPSIATTILPQFVSSWLSPDNGTSWVWLGFQDVTEPDQEILVMRPKPTSDQSWKVAIKIGQAGGDPAIRLATASLPSGVIFSDPFTVGGLAAPGSRLGLALTVAPGEGGVYPYDAVATGEQHYWKIPSISYDDSGLVDSDAFFVRITARDFGADGSYIGPEHAFAGDGITPDDVNDYTLVGNYGTDGYSYTRTAPIAGVEFKIYVGNRKNQTTASFTDPTSMTFQEDVGAVRVIVASGGNVPGTALHGAGNVTLGTLTYDNLYNGNYLVNIPYAPPEADEVFAGVLIEVEIPDRTAAAPLRADGTMPWGTNPALGSQKPLSFGPFGDDESHFASVMVPAPAVDSVCRVRVRSVTINAINSADTSPSATILLPSYRGYTITESGSAFTACATWGMDPCSVSVPYNVNGQLEQDLKFVGITAPDDLRFGGWEIWSSGWPDDSGYYQESPTQPLYANSTTITVKAPKRQMPLAFWLVSLSIDSHGVMHRNPIIPGVTPVVTKLLGTNDGTIDLTDVITGSFNPNEFHINPDTGIFETLNVDMTKAQGLSEQFHVVGNVQRITNLDVSGVLLTGQLQVGGGGQKVSQLKIFNAAGNQSIGWIGDDTTGSGYVGAWFKQVLIGGTSPATAKISADSSGNVAIAGDLLTSGTVSIGGGGGKPGKIRIFDNSGAAIGWIGDDYSTSGYVGAWFKQILIGGTSPADAKIKADAAGNVTIAGSITGTAANITGTLSVTQIGTGQLPVGVVYAGNIQCGQLQSGTVNASITLKSAALDITSGSLSLKVDVNNGFYYSNGSSCTLKMNAAEGFKFSGSHLQLQISEDTDGTWGTRGLILSDINPSDAKYNYQAALYPDQLVFTSGSVASGYTLISRSQIIVRNGFTGSQVTIDANGIKINGRSL